jgi:hypothetical protein
MVTLTVNSFPLYCTPAMLVRWTWRLGDAARAVTCIRFVFCFECKKCVRVRNSFTTVEIHGEDVMSPQSVVKWCVHLRAGSVTAEDCETRKQQSLLHEILETGYLTLWIKQTDELKSNFIGITILHVSGSLSAHHQELLAVLRLRAPDDGQKGCPKHVEPYYQWNWILVRLLVSFTMNLSRSRVICSFKKKGYLTEYVT